MADPKILRNLATNLVYCEDGGTPSPFFLHIFKSYQFTLKLSLWTQPSFINLCLCWHATIAMYSTPMAQSYISSCCHWFCPSTILSPVETCSILSEPHTKEEDHVETALIIVIMGFAVSTIHSASLCGDVYMGMALLSIKVSESALGYEWPHSVTMYLVGTW